LTNTDVIRRIRYAFDFNDSKMIAIFGHADHEITREEVSAWLKRDEDPDFKNCGDTQLATFLNGLIIDRRGRKDGPLAIPEKRLSNNIVLRKLKIALDLKADDMLEIMALADLRISKHELSALFRKPDHKHYRACKDQILRNFLQGMQLKFRGDANLEGEEQPA
jgi:uncharacterized protein YehS (DUF1456 family)